MIVSLPGIFMANLSSSVPQFWTLSNNPAPLRTILIESVRHLVLSVTCNSGEGGISRLTLAHPDNHFCSPSVWLFVAFFQKAYKFEFYD